MRSDARQRPYTTHTRGAGSGSSASSSGAGGRLHTGGASSSGLSTISTSTVFLSEPRSRTRTPPSGAHPPPRPSTSHTQSNKRQPREVPTEIYCPVEQMRLRREAERINTLCTTTTSTITTTSSSTSQLPSPPPLRGILKRPGSQRGGGGFTQMNPRSVGPFGSGSGGGGCSRRSVRFDEGFLESHATQQQQSGSTATAGHRKKKTDGSALRDDELGLSWDNLDLSRLLDDEEKAGPSAIVDPEPKGSRRAGGGWGGDSEWFNEQFGIGGTAPSTSQQQQQQPSSHALNRSSSMESGSSSCASTPTNRPLSEIEKGMLRAMVRANHRSGRCGPPDRKKEEAAGVAQHTASNASSPPNSVPRRRTSISWDLSTGDDGDEPNPRRVVPIPM